MKEELYQQLYKDLAALLDGETDFVARMAETAALLKERMGFFWVGFYRVVAAPDDSGPEVSEEMVTPDSELVLGPFQGPAACLRIAYGRGVCGTAWKEARTVVVPDVEAFPGHIACSSLSKSEIVVPVFAAAGTGADHRVVTAVLDIDSTSLGAFDEIDARWLEKICELI